MIKRNAYLILIFSIVLTSCMSSGRIFEIKDSNREIESLKLIQKVQGNSVDKTEGETGSQVYSVSTTYKFEITKGEKSSIQLDIQIGNPNQTFEIDSMAFWDLDGEKIRIVAHKDGITQSKTYQYNVPENLWVSVANTDKIQYRLYIGKEGIDVKLNFAQTNKLKEFLNKSIHLRNANLPPPTEGLKKL